MPKYHLTPDGKNNPLNSTVKDYAVKNNSYLHIQSVIEANSVQFPAFLTDFSQTFDATWNTEDVFGRMDPIATYQGTKRTMSLGFDVPAGNIQEAKWNLESCALLVTMVYPAYNDVNGAQVVAKPPLVRIKFANLISGPPSADNLQRANLPNPFSPLVPTDGGIGGRVDPRNPFSPFASTGGSSSAGLLGWISGLSWKPVIENGMFIEDGKLYPKIVSISFSFNILHERVMDQKSLSETFGNKNKTSWPFGD